MTVIATLGPEGSDNHQAAQQYAPDADLLFCNTVSELIYAYQDKGADQIVVPVYNTREGEIKEYFRIVAGLESFCWVDNIMLPIQLSMGSVTSSPEKIDTIIGRGSVFNQCKDYLKSQFCNATPITVQDIEPYLVRIVSENKKNYGVIESEPLLKKFGLSLISREVVSHNKTRFAVLGHEKPAATGYDATAIITRPLKDRVGMLVDILSEFTRRGINILDLRSENDIETQKLQIYLEIEGYHDDAVVKEALLKIERGVIQEHNSLKVLGSFPRIDMRVKRIRSFGFIGTGEMSRWFANRLENEGYLTYLTGRSTELTPEQMIEKVNVVIICVPISVTPMTIARYAKLLRDGQALILLAGESENNLKTAIEETREGVEVMLVHNLWGPQAATMKDKNAVVVRTQRSGVFCSEFEAFLYKHGAEIYQDSATEHDLLMGFGQKLPTMISMALASTLAQHNISTADIGTHSTLTSIYGILAMARIHNQNPRTYAEISATKGDGRKLVKTFAENLRKVIELSDEENIEALCELMESNRNYLTPAFLQSRMAQARAVDDILNESGFNYNY